MPYENICFDTEGQLAVVTLNRPKRRNALSLELMLELINCLSRIGEDLNLRAVILAAAGNVFSSGHDLSEMVGRDINEYRRIFDVCSELMTKIQSIPQPVIAQVQGIATAAGCQLVAACDLAVAGDEATFATPGVKIGLFCTTPMVPLVRAIPAKPGMEMLLTGAPITAHRALELGLVNRVVPNVDLDLEIKSLTDTILAMSPLVIRTGKRAFYEIQGLDEAGAYDRAVPIMTANALCHDAQE